LSRSLDELIDREHPAWPELAHLLHHGSNVVEVLGSTSEDSERTLRELAVSTASPLGALAFETGGVLVDHGWLRILGAGNDRALPRDLATYNFGAAGARAPRVAGAMVIADDAVGGAFAVNGGAFDGDQGSVFYLSPDTLAWEDLGADIRGFLRFAAEGDLAQFYRDLRWPSWRDDLQSLGGDEAILIYPFPWAEGPVLAERQRKVVPLEELWAVQLEMQRMMGGE